MSVCDNFGRRLPEPKYYVIWVDSIGKPSVKGFSKKELLDHWNPLGEGESSRYVDEIPHRVIANNWGGKAVIIKGEIVVPIVKEVDLP